MFHGKRGCYVFYEKTDVLLRAHEKVINPESRFEAALTVHNQVSVGSLLGESR